MKTAIRLALSVILLYFVYGETGPATTIAMGLMFISAELSAYVQSATTDAIETIGALYGRRNQ